jgi:hypothetical protein
MAGVGGSSQAGLRGEVSEDQNGGFTRDALGPAEDVLVRDQVAHHQDSTTLESLDDAEKPGAMHRSA